MTAPRGGVLRINHHFAWRFAYGVAEPPDGRGEMKRALLRVATASVLVSGMIGAASAADLVVKAPIVAPVPVFSWTGVYIGIGGGSGWGTRMRPLLRSISRDIPFSRPPSALSAIPKARIRSVAAFSAARSGAIGRSAGLSSVFRPTRTGRISTAKARVSIPARVSAPPLSASATIAAPRYRASAASRAASAPRSTARSSMPRADGPGSKASSI